MFILFVEYSREKNMVFVILLVSTIGLHQISNEVLQNNFLALAALLLTSFKLFLSIFNL